MKRTALARRKPLERRTRMHREHDPASVEAYCRLRTSAFLRARWKCEHCGNRLAAPYQGELAHVHPLGRGRSRYDTEARCSLCETWLNRLNRLDNVRFVCSSRWGATCNEEAAREFRAAGGCRRQE